MRGGPGAGYAALTAFGAGTELAVLDGPLAGDDGRLWYQVAGHGLGGLVRGGMARAPRPP
jgi:hypothetical protein